MYGLSLSQSDQIILCVFHSVYNNTKYSMSIIGKVFKYEETELSVIKRKDDIWFRGKTIAEILGYSNPLKAIRKHVDSDDKKKCRD